MVCTDQEAGKRGGPEPLLTLAAYRRTRGRIHFGVLLDHAPAAGSVEVLEVGDVVVARPSARPEGLRRSPGAVSKLASCWTTLLQQGQ